MSRLAGLLLVVLGATAFADTTEPSASPPKTEESTPSATPAKPAKFPLRVVKVLPDSEQALLFDKNRGRHILVEIGEAVGDYTVAAIDEDEVTLTGKDLPVEVVLAAPESRKERRAKKAARDAKAAAAVVEAETATDAAPADPYGEEEPREASVEAPIRATQWGTSRTDGAEGEKSSTSPFANMSADAAKPSEDVANAGKPPVAKKPAPAPTAEIETADVEPAVKATAEGPTRLSKKEVSAALDNFAVLAAAIDGSFTQTGLTLEKVQAGSVFAKAGLSAGDVVTAVDGKPLRSIDDAADLYARAGSMKSASVQIVRAGKPQTIRIAIQ
jgi:hypothetical protein